MTDPYPCRGCGGPIHLNQYHGGSYPRLCPTCRALKKPVPKSLSNGRARSKQLLLKFDEQTLESFRTCCYQHQQSMTAVLEGFMTAYIQKFTPVSAKGLIGVGKITKNKDYTGTKHKGWCGHKGEKNHE